MSGLMSRRDKENARAVGRLKAGTQAAVVYHPPRTTRRRVLPVRLLATMTGPDGDLIRHAVATEPGEHEFIDELCGLCGACWDGKWREDGSPIYDGGVLDAWTWNRKHGKWILNVEACTCEAGLRYIRQNMPAASDHTKAVHKRLARMRRRAFRRMVTPAGVEIAIQDWPRQAVTLWSQEVNRLMASGVAKGEAMQRAFCLIGNDWGARGMLP